MNNYAAGKRSGGGGGTNASASHNAFSNNNIDDESPLYWTCSFCTLEGNPQDFLACKTCGTPRQATTEEALHRETTAACGVASLPSSTLAAAADDSSSEPWTSFCWTCQRCTFAGNPMFQKSCRTCEATRSDAEFPWDSILLTYLGVLEELLRQLASLGGKKQHEEEEEEEDLQPQLQMQLSSLLLQFLDFTSSEIYAAEAIQSIDFSTKCRLLRIFTLLQKTGITGDAGSQMRLLWAMSMAKLLIIDASDDGDGSFLVDLDQDESSKSILRDCVNTLCSATQDLNVTFFSDTTLSQPATKSYEASIIEMATLGERARGILAQGPIRTAAALPTGMNIGFAARGNSDILFAQATPMSSGLKRIISEDSEGDMKMAALPSATDASALLDSLTTLVDYPNPEALIENLVRLMTMAEKDPIARDEMLMADAFEPLLNVYEYCDSNNYSQRRSCQREVKTLVALTVAYLLRSCYPRNLPDVTATGSPKRRAVLNCLDTQLRDAKMDVIIGAQTGVEQAISFEVQLLAYIGNQARNYFTLVDRSMAGRQEQQYDDVGKLDSKLPAAIGRPLLRRGRTTTIGAAALQIESAIGSLGSSNLDRKLDAVLILMKYAKERATHRALMQNYGVFARLLDILRSSSIGSTAAAIEENDAISGIHHHLKVAAAMAIAYIVPTLEDRSIWMSYKSELHTCLRLLEPYTQNTASRLGATLSGQEVEWAIGILRGFLEDQQDAARAKQSRWNAANPDGHAQKNHPAVSLQVDLENVDLEEVYRAKDVASLLMLMRTGSCRIVDAALLLLMLAKAGETEICKKIVEEGLDLLLTIFFRRIEASGGDLRLMAAMTVELVVPFVRLPAKKEQAASCILFLQENMPEAQRTEIRATNKVSSTGNFKLEPTSYTYYENKLAGVVLLNSLGFKSEFASDSASWLWEDIEDCKIASSALSVVMLSTIENDKKDWHTFDFHDGAVAQHVVEDVTYRHRLFQRSHKALPQKDGMLSIPQALNISCADNPQFLGVSVYHLSEHFIQNVASTPGLTKASKFHEIEDLDKETGFVRQKGESVICPLDGRMGAAYVHCLQGADHVGMATHMLSWTWVYSVREVVDTLAGYCETNKIDPKRTYVWMCCLCLNQHRIVEGNNNSGIGSISSVDFGAEFTFRVIGIGRVLVMMRPWGDPSNLKRIWCIFEIFMALKENCDVAIVMPSLEKDRMMIQLFPPNEESSGHGIDNLYRALNQVDVEKAEASVAQDRIMILERIREERGFREVNLLVQDRLRAWIRGVLDELVEDRSLDARISADGDEDNVMADAERLSYADFLKKVADVFDLYGDYAGASDMYSQCLRIRQSARELNDVKVAEAYDDCGRALSSQGSYASSLDSYLKALRIREKVLGKDDLQTAATNFHIGVLLQQMGDTEEALVMLQKCALVQESKLGKTHRDTALTYSHIGLLLGKRERGGSYYKGLEITHETLQLFKDLLGEHHPKTGFCYGVLATLLLESDLDNALINAEKCCTIQEEALGRKHPFLGKTYDLLGTIFKRQMKPQKALRRFQQALEIHEANAQNADDHLAVAMTSANMSVLSFFLGDRAEAKRFHRRVLRALGDSNGFDVLDQDLILVYSTSGEMFYEKGNHEAAIFLFRQGLDLMEAMLGKDHPDLAEGHEAVGVALYEKGDYRGALQEYERSLAIRNTDVTQRDTPKVLETTRLIAGITTQWLERRSGEEMQTR